MGIKPGEFFPVSSGTIPLNVISLPPEMPIEGFMSFSFESMMFAMEVHKDQKRKYTELPYWTHLAEVSGLVATYNIISDISISVAWLHDCMEDCGVTFDILQKKFGVEIANGVLLLSDLEEGNREIRKKLSRERLSNAPKWIQNIKICDLISNTPSIIQYDPKFAKVYLEEARLLLDVLKKANTDLLSLARNIIA